MSMQRTFLEDTQETSKDGYLGDEPRDFTSSFYIG